MYDFPIGANPHFFNRYLTLIAYFQINPSNDSYVERHHIVPRCLNGTDDPVNIVKLSARGHYLAHWLLMKAYPTHIGLTYAFIKMNHSNTLQDRKSNARLYEAARRSCSLLKSANSRGELNHYFGKKHSADVRAKISSAKRGKPNNSWNTGKTKATDAKVIEVGLSISAAVKGMRHWTNGLTTTKSRECPGPGWTIGRAKNVNFKLSEAQKKLRKERANSNPPLWWNDGISNKRAAECPGSNWKRGRIMSASHMHNLISGRK